MGQVEKRRRMDKFGLYEQNLISSGLTCGCCDGAYRSFFILMGNILKIYCFALGTMLYTESILGGDSDGI